MSFFNILKSSSIQIKDRNLILEDILSRFDSIKIGFVNLYVYVKFIVIMIIINTIISYPLIIYNDNSCGVFLAIACTNAMIVYD